MNLFTGTKTKHPRLLQGMCSLILGCYLNTAHADASISDVVGGLNNVVNAINNISQQIVSFAQYELGLNSTQTSADATSMFQASPDTNVAQQFYYMVGEAMNTFQGLINIDQTTQNNVVNVAWQSAMATSQGAAFPTILTQNEAAAAVTALATPMQSVFPQSADSNTNFPNPAQPGDPFVNFVNNYSIDTILAAPNDTLTTNQQPIATTFINSLVGLGLGFINGATPAQMQNYVSKNSTPGLVYLAMMANYASNLSVGMSTLNQIAARRYPQQQIANLGLVASDGQTQVQSLAQLEKYMAQRRVSSPIWYATMAAASPATVQRETLFVLAEMRYQQYEMQLQQERIMATLAAIQLAGTQSVGLLALNQQQQAAAAGGKSLTSS